MPINQTTGTKEAVFAAIESGETIWFVEGWSSASLGASDCHRIGQGFVAADSAPAAKAVCNGDTTRGRKVYGYFGFGSGHVKTAKLQSRESVERALRPLAGRTPA